MGVRGWGRPVDVDVRTQAVQVRVRGRDPVAVIRDRQRARITADTTRTGTTAGAGGDAAALIAATPAQRPGGPPEDAAARIIHAQAARIRIWHDAWQQTGADNASRTLALARYIRGKTILIEGIAALYGDGQARAAHRADILIGTAHPPT